ncbi:terpenoid synthase [Podospora aff. communis PSN243]|uniref:Terpene synthase n=1 Tax=Podospora aff. communis PSN243 TaxID=3040156 RepID=A0AAV9FVH6_9PEZI|nr:terpenoid synthase [Podospora aff. communis PSN243]
MAAVRVKIPNFMANWPFERQLNPHYEAAKAASQTWLHNFELFDGKPHDAFNRCDFQQARVGCELMILFYAFDEYTDVENGAGARKIADIMINALHHPEKPRPAGEIPLGELARQFWSRALPVASPMSQRHFLQTMEEYANGCVQQAEDRAANRIRAIDDYWAVRRLTSGCFPTFTMIELGLDFPAEVYMHPLLVRLREIIMQSVSAINDVLSYNVERLRGHELHNLITAVMHEKSLTLPDAVGWIGNFHDSLVTEYMTCREKVSRMRAQWGDEIANQVDRYVEGLGEWAKGNHCWHFESQRYFGLDGPKVQREGELWMLPPAARDSAGLHITTKAF